MPCLGGKRSGYITKKWGGRDFLKKVVDGALDAQQSMPYNTLSRHVIFSTGYTGLLQRAHGAFIVGSGKTKQVTAGTNGSTRCYAVLIEGRSCSNYTELPAGRGSAVQKKIMRQVAIILMSVSTMYGAGARYSPSMRAVGPGIIMIEIS